MWEAVIKIASFCEDQVQSKSMNKFDWLSSWPGLASHRKSKREEEGKTEEN